jgi:hypothetical protein
MNKTVILLSLLLAIVPGTVLADESETSVQVAAKKAIDTYLAKTPVIDYPELRRNGLFPFAVVARIDANETQKKFFGRDLEESLHDDLVDMLRHNINTWYNFCDGTDWRARLARCEAVGIRLIETRFCTFNFTTGGQQDLADFVEESKSPALYAWYGPDEPPAAAIPGFIANKKRVFELDSKHPYTSALCSKNVRNLLGPVMEVMLPDVYFGLGTENDPSIFIKHFEDARHLRSITRGKGLWFMTQTFSNRSQKEPNQEPLPVKVFTARYPTPLEIRLDMNCIAAGGATGISFFIYNGVIPYWGSYDVENFDFTLVDPWGNGSETYNEIATFGEKIVPIMPSIMDAEPSETIPVSYDKDMLLLGQSANKLGTYLYFVNKSLKKAYRGRPNVKLPESYGLFNLVTLERTTESFELAPGDGVIIAVCTPEKFAVLKSEIVDRRKEKQMQISKLRTDELKRAGFVDGIASEKWLAAEKALEQVRSEFGVIHQMLVPAAVITRVYNATELEPLKVRMCDLSRKYFAMKHDLAKGRVPAASAIDALREAVKVLAGDYRNSTILSAKTVPVAQNTRDAGEKRNAEAKEVKNN